MTAPNAKDGFEKVLARGLRGAADGSGHDCPDAEVLAAHFERSLSVEETQRWEAHFSVCTRCQEQLAALVRSEPAPEAARQPFRLLNWRWLTPLAAASAAVLLWVVLQPSRPTDVALNRAGKVSESAPAVPALPSAMPAEPPTTLTDKIAPSKDASLAPAGAKAKEEAATRAKALHAPAEGDVGALSKEALKNQTQATEGRGEAGTLSATRPAEKKAQDEFAARKVQGDRPDRQNVAEAVQVQTAPAVLDREQKPDQRTAPVAAPPPPPPGRLAQSAEAGKEAEKSQQANETLKRERRALDALETRNGAAGLASKVSIEPRFVTPDGKVAYRYAKDKLERSADAGQTWELPFAPPRPVLAGACPKEKVCWAVGEAGLVLRTTDGANWEVLPAPTEANLVSVTAKDAESATVTTTEGKSYQTSDAGKTWKPL